MGKKRYLITFLAPWVVMLASALIGASGHEASARTFTDSICAFLLTVLLLKQFVCEKKEIVLQTVVLICGYLSMMIPLFFSFKEDYFAQADIFIVLVSMLLAAVCFHTRRISVFLLSVVILLLLNTYGIHAWMEFVK